MLRATIRRAAPPLQIRLLFEDDVYVHTPSARKDMFARLRNAFCAPPCALAAARHARVVRAFRVGLPRVLPMR